MLTDVERQPGSHTDHLLIVPGATHGKSLLNEIQLAFPRSQILQGNVNLPQKPEVCVFHGMFNPINIKLLDLFASQGTKIIWSVWGGDLYRLDPLNLPNWTKKLYGIIAPDLDTDLLMHYEGMLFFSPNFYMPKTPKVERPKSPSAFDLQIIVGNSGDPSNRHEEVLQVLMKSKLNLLISIPLAYNTHPDYRAQLDILVGSSSFSHEVNFIDSLLAADRYSELFSRSDLAIYHHPRQQGMGSMRLAVRAGCPITLDFEVPSSSESKVRINPCLSGLIKMGATSFFDTRMLLENFSDDLLKQLAKPLRTAEAKTNSDENMQVADYLRLLHVTNRYEKR